MRGRKIRKHDRQRWRKTWNFSVRNMSQAKHTKTKLFFQQDLIKMEIFRAIFNECCMSSVNYTKKKYTTASCNFLSSFWWMANLASWLQHYILIYLHKVWRQFSIERGTQNWQLAGEETWIFMIMWTFPDSLLQYRKHAAGKKSWNFIKDNDEN